MIWTINISYYDSIRKKLNKVPIILHRNNAKNRKGLRY